MKACGSSRVLLPWRSAFSVQRSSRLPLMSKPPRTVFACTNCGAQSPKWLGRCPDCGAWNTLAEEAAAPPLPAGGAAARVSVGSRREGAALCRRRHAAGRAHLDGHRRVRSRARRRPRARQPGAARRRTRHRQEHAAAAGGGGVRAAHRAGPLLLGRGVRAPDQGPGRAARRRPGAALSSGRDLHRAHPRRSRSGSSRRC